MADKIHAPWTLEQVHALNEFQQRGGMHPFTCGNDQHGQSIVLMAHRDGWHCSDPACGYRQDWAHAFMADPNKWPKSFPAVRVINPQSGTGIATGGNTPRRERLGDVQGRCPACHWQTLFLGNGGHVTCARLDCPDPTAADDLLHGERAAAVGPLVPPAVMDAIRRDEAEQAATAAAIDTATKGADGCTDACRNAPGIRGLLEHVGIDTRGRDITVDGRVVDAAPEPRCPGCGHHEGEGCGCPPTSPTDEDFLVAIEAALERQLLSWLGPDVVQRYRDVIAAAIDPLVAQLRRDRDLAIAHDRQPYPTAWAYEQACAALERHRARAGQLGVLLAEILPLFTPLATRDGQPIVYTADEPIPAARMQRWRAALQPKETL